MKAGGMRKVKVCSCDGLEDREVKDMEGDRIIK
jgi:hypothetical protein